MYRRLGDKNAIRTHTHNDAVGKGFLDIFFFLLNLVCVLCMCVLPPRVKFFLCVCQSRHPAAKLQHPRTYLRSIQTQPTQRFFQNLFRMNINTLKKRSIVINHEPNAMVPLIALTLLSQFRYTCFKNKIPIS